MLQRSPDIPPPTPLLPFEILPDLLEQKPIDQRFFHPNRDSFIVEKLAKSRRADLVGAYALATTLALTFPYAYDVAVNRSEEANNIPTIKTIVEAPPDVPGSGGITYYMNGFDTSNANGAANKLAPAFAQISPDEMKSIDYGNASINADRLTDLVIEDLLKEDKKEVSFVFNSASGITGAEMILKILKDTNIRVKNVYNYETPDGVEGLLPGTKKDLALMQDAVSFIPGAEDSDHIRTLITVLIDGGGGSRWTDPNKSIYENVLSFFSINQRAIEQTKEKKRPRVELMNNYGWIIANADIEKSLAQIGELRDDEVMPTFVYMRSTTRPNVVDTEKSGKNYCEYAKKALLSCFILDVDSKVQIHTSYNFDTEANVKAIAAGKEEIDISNQKNLLTYRLSTSPYYRFGSMIAE